MNVVSKAIAVTLIIMAVIATGYTGYFAMEYSSSLSALAEFSAYAEFDPEDIQEKDNMSYIAVTITMENPSDIEVNVYELDIALFLMNSTNGDFERIGLPVLFYSQYYPIVVDANSEGKVIFYLYIDDVDDYRWNVNYSHDHGLELRVDPYMELRYKIADYDFTNMYAWGVWHWTCKPCGRGPFD